MIQQQPTVVPVVSAQQAYGVAPPLRTVEVKTTLSLGVTQLAIGSLSVILGIANAVTLHYYFSTAGSGIWGGLWILIGGIIGIFSAKRPTSIFLNGRNMAFAIVSTLIAFLDVIFYSSAIGHFRYFYPVYYYPYSDTTHTPGVAMSTTLLILMILEFVISLAVVIYCCKFTCGCCGNDNSSGVIVQQGQPHAAVFQSSGVSVAPPPMMTYTTNLTSQPGQPPMQYGFAQAPAYNMQTQQPQQSQQMPPPPSY